MNELVGLDLYLKVDSICLAGGIYALNAVDYTLTYINSNRIDRDIAALDRKIGAQRSSD